MKHLVKVPAQLLHVLRAQAQVAHEALGKAHEALLSAAQRGGQEHALLRRTRRPTGRAR